jgi:O-succinylbenzoic acid--CoA ligase
MERAELRALVQATGCAVEEGGCVFLCDPDAPVAEQAEAKRQMGLSRSVGPDPGAGWLCVRTGGSGGTMKFARHDEATLGAAVNGFCAHFRMARVNAIDVLPAHHVSGLMARVRSAATGGQHCAWNWKKLEAGALPPVSGNEWVLSLVPTQLQRLLGSPSSVAWLRGLKIIFLGGGPVWPELADAAAAAGLPIALSYGMTETAAMVAALQPEEFLAGARSSGQVMPHVRVVVEPADGVLKISGGSVFRGYWPEWRNEREFTTEDIGRIDERGHLYVVGRRDGMIITGGKKVNTTDVEAALRASGEFLDVAVIGVPDREWGEVVVACFAQDRSREPDLSRAVEALAAHQRPKRFVPIEEWPRNLQGKVNRAKLRAMVEAQLG